MKSPLAEDGVAVHDLELGDPGGTVVRDVESDRAGGRGGLSRVAARVGELVGEFRRARGRVLGVAAAGEHERAARDRSGQIGTSGDHQTSDWVVTAAGWRRRRSNGLDGRQRSGQITYRPTGIAKTR